ncbi:acetyl-CoA synthetase-like protein [Basidiobolus meristosporus CBS 931.73]|uniref:Long-chain-fatty-acid--CoA ligase n=1 Tax=Basidiobolus meristosporus CBS 931.73 TaxID=1314790 RepID=A0A1Y1WXH2_9FUNG|nr:acetyl-CoA synthetase-like protein [Basidiobolus meristosporus CBS 931.73]|eukprot:ORX78269.1 acetyl-CoA synthetase-like protein [Basidiobolus meristosporus CBS 931.73]
MYADVICNGLSKITIGPSTIVAWQRPLIQAKNVGNGTLIATPPGINSLHDVFMRGLDISRDSPCLGHRKLSNGVAGPYVWYTYQEVFVRMHNLASGLHHLGLRAREPLGLFAINRVEWVLAEKATYFHNYISVPLYDTLGSAAIEFIINQTEMKIVLATKDKAETLLSMRHKLPTLEKIVIMDCIDEKLTLLASAASVSIFSLAEVEDLGRKEPVEGSPPELDDTFTISYTSGTTGAPKGVVLTHRTLLTEYESFIQMAKLDLLFKLDSSTVHLSYLPLAHVFERVIQNYVMYHGGRIGFYQGNPTKLFDDAQELQPTLFISVPRLFNRIYDTVMQEVKQQGGITQYLFEKAYAAKEANLRNGITTHRIWDWLVFGKVRSKLGGRVETILTAAAPILPEVLDFLRICFSCDVYEAYGQTEAAGAITVTTRGDLQTGSTGPPLPGCEIKLVDIPSMGYSSLDEPFPRGEVWARGSLAFREYFKCPEKTAEVIDHEGWCRTGDVGMWDERGRLVIIDRVKNIYKLAQGEYISPERIENIYCKHELVAQSFVYGNSLQAYLVAIIIPNPELIQEIAREKQLENVPVEQLCQSKEIQAHYLKQLRDYGAQQGLKGFENIRNLRISTQPFTVENNLLTPTFKLKRNEVRQKYESEIECMYSEIGSRYP